MVRQRNGFINSFIYFVWKPINFTVDKPTGKSGGINYVSCTMNY